MMLRPLTIFAACCSAMLALALAVTPPVSKALSSVPPDVFVPFGVYLPGQPMREIRVMPGCADLGDRWYADYLICTLDGGAVDHVVVTGSETYYVTGDDAIRSTSLYFRERSLLVGDLVACWGRWDRQVKSRNFALLVWTERGARAYIRQRWAYMHSAVWIVGFVSVS